jgi:2-oxoglutarate ferredoxin oxidoreductase subunit alpha
VQECADFTYEAFDLADRYRMPVIIQADGMIGQMMEGVTLPPPKEAADLPKRDWSVGHMGRESPGRESRRRESRHITSIHLVPEELEAVTRTRYERYDTIRAGEIRYEYSGPGSAARVISGKAADGPAPEAAGITGDVDITMVAYGTSARVCLGAKQLAEQAGIRAALFRPVTLWPFPYKALGSVAAAGKPILTVEMSLGQLVEDVKLSLLEAPEESKRAAVHLLGHSGGVIPTEEEVFAEIRRILGR